MPSSVARAMWAAVVPRDDAPITVAELAAYARENMSVYMAPRRFLIKESLPVGLYCQYRLEPERYSNMRVAGLAAKAAKVDEAVQGLEAMRTACKEAQTRAVGLAQAFGKKPIQHKGAVYQVAGGKLRRQELTNLDG